MNYIIVYVVFVIIFATTTLSTFFVSPPVFKTRKSHSLYLKPEGINEVATRRFLDWGDKYGVQATKCSIQQFAGGLRGIVALEDITDNFISVSVPADLVIQTNNNRPPTPFNDFVSQSFWSDCKWDHRLAFLLLHEIKNYSKTATAKKDWLDSLPLSFSTPYYWKDDNLDKMQYPALKIKIEKQRSDWELLYNRWITGGKPSSLLYQVSFKDFIWALECVNSRAFSGVYEGTSASERRSLLLFTGLLTAIWPLIGLGTSEQSLSAAFLVAVGIITKDFFFSRAAGLKRYVICPYIDMFNHKSTSISDVSYTYFSDNFELKSQGYKKGEQIFISYGKQSNDRLLQYYGFIDSENPYDIYDFGLGFLELILKYADHINEKVPIPLEPSPQARLKQIATAIRSTIVQDSKTSQSQKSSLSVREEENTRYYRQIPMSTEKKKTKEEKISILNHFDDITSRSMRALFSSKNEWEIICKQSGGDGSTLLSLNNLGVYLSEETEKQIISASQALINLELESKATTLEEDIQLLTELELLRHENESSSIGDSKEMYKKGFSATTKENLDIKINTKKKEKVIQKVDPSGYFNDSDFSALTFRIAKKRILVESLLLLIPPP